MNRAETSGGKSNEISNYRFSGGRWAKPSNRDIFGGVVRFHRFFAGFFAGNSLFFDREVIVTALPLPTNAYWQWHAIYEFIFLKRLLDYIIPLYPA